MRHSFVSLKRAIPSDYTTVGDTFTLVKVHSDHDFQGVLFRIWYLLLYIQFYTLTIRSSILPVRTLGLLINNSSMTPILVAWSKVSIPLADFGGTSGNGFWETVQNAKLVPAFFLSMDTTHTLKMGSVKTGWTWFKVSVTSSSCTLCSLLTYVWSFA